MARRVTVKSIIVLAALAVLMPVTPLMAGQKCATAMQDSCLSCHGLDRTCQELGKDKEYWQTTVTRMGRYAPSISAESQEILSSCLAKEKEGIKELCQQ